MYIHPTRGREKLRQPFRSWREGAHDDRSTAHADRNKAITVSILMQRVGVWINGGRWRGIVSTPSLVWWFQREVGHEILERSKRRPFSAESKQVPRWKNVLATNGGLSLSREGLCRGSWWTGVCPGQPSSLSAVLLSRPLSSDHARNTRCCPLLLSLSFVTVNPLLFFLVQIICPRDSNASTTFWHEEFLMGLMYKVVEKNFCRKDNIFISTWNFTISEYKRSAFLERWKV